MKNHFPTITKLVAAAVCALSLGSCSRAEYAMLPQGASYHGVARAATPVPTATAVPTPTVAVAPAAVATTEAQVVATPAAAPVATAAPATREVAVANASVSAAATVAAASVPKLSLVQRMALSKVTHKMDKLMQKSGAVRQHDNTASTSKTAAISGNLRIGIILLLVGLLVGIFNGLIGSIIALIGVIFIVLWLLDSL